MMSFLESAFATVLTHSYVSIIILIVILILRKVLHRYLSPVAIYAMWFLLLVKLIVPIAPQSMLSMFNLLPQTAPNNINWQQTYEATTVKPLEDIKKEGEVTVTSLPQTQKDGAQLTNRLQKSPSQFESITRMPTANNSNSESNQPLHALSLFSLIWLSGVILLSAYYCISNWRFRHLIIKTRRSGDTRLNDILVQSKQQLGIHSNITIYETSYVRSPCLYGVFKPSIYLPEDIIAIATNHQLDHIVKHELMHFKRKDLWINLLWTISLCIHWFNPIVWWAVHKMRLDQEIACDTGVLSHLDGQEVSEYGLTLLMMTRLFKSSSVPQVHLSSFYNRKSDTKRRIIMVANFKKGSYKMTALAILLLFVLGAVLLTNSPSSQNNNASGNEPQATNTSAALEKNILLSSSSSSMPYARNAESFKWFHSLDRALQFKEFDFKVPDFIPNGYMLDNIWSTKSFVHPERADQTAAVTIFYSNNKKQEQYRSFEVIAGLEVQSLIDQNMLWGVSNHSVTESGQASLTIDNITGTLYTEAPPEGQKNNTKAILGHSFVWEDQGITYVINFKNTKSNTAKTNLDGVISRADLAQIVASFVEPLQVQHVNYSGEGNSFPIYTKDDLTTVQNILGFKPKLPVVIQDTGFEILNTLLLRKHDTNTNLTYSRTEDALESSYRIKSFAKTKEYDLNDDITLLQSKKPLLNTNKLSYKKGITLNGLNILVYTEEEQSYLKTRGEYTGDNGRKTLQIPTYYTWNQDDVYYTVAFTFFEKDINYDELLRALILSLESN
ncbi:bla regulator protein BlaR1 [Paenibacillus turicensis]|uniref:Bla regulator protein BlaR1 n=1 Tax=Paenibacillus turicensis TaxID=160487 RepID=A0ABS4FRY0_9BACL|nr:M56 family metallopeptidase [Paenibacillus turicensis]MBP1905336.1 bla regulator protein BlaR1 [Paenibacillus turicensis]